MSKVLTIQRSKWRRGLGEGNIETKLLSHDGTMCCLGFDALACGLTKQQILDKETPLGIVESMSEVPSLPEEYRAGRIARTAFTFNHTAAVLRAIDHNDDEAIPDEEREALIRSDLKAVGWDEVEFVD